MDDDDDEVSHYSAKRSWESIRDDVKCLVPFIADDIEVLDAYFSQF